MGNSTVKGRLLEYLKSKKISQTEFTRNLGVSTTYIGAMRKGIPADKIKKIGQLYPDLNKDWLLYGDGEMIVDPTLSGSRPTEYETLLLPVEAFAGNLQMWSRGVAERDCKRIISPVSGADFAIPVKGDSMEPQFHDGSTLLIKRINERAFIPWGYPMVIDTENGVLLKKVYPANPDDFDSPQPYIVAKSVNPDYPPMKIPTDSIYGLYRVMGSVELFPTY